MTEISSEDLIFSIKTYAFLYPILKKYSKLPALAIWIRDLNIYQQFVIITGIIKNPFIEWTVLHKDLVFIKWQWMSVLNSLEKFGEKDSFFKK